MIKQKAGYRSVSNGRYRLTAYPSAEDVPMGTARDLLRSHINWAYGEFRRLGAPEFDPTPHITRFFDHFDEVLPPNGAYLIAHDMEGNAVGTGALRRISDSSAEMK